jgi:hypothetical protein
MERAIIIIALALSVAGLGHCNRAHAADNTVIIDQIGSNNQTTVVQDGSNNRATITTGATADVDYATFSITQQGNNKTASIEVKSGINTTASIQQSGAGNHTASIQNLTGSGNNISVTQQGDGNHEFNVINGTGTTNSGNTINATQSGGVGSDKWFNVWLNGATGANVQIQQGGTGASQSSMAIQCMPGTCGTWSYTRQ